ncbi:MAG: hypothetical protein IJD11_00115 [Oscillospiraceae bacterium]|nr:hypothetical protein [Oscillospiraceae bacterium]
MKKIRMIAGLCALAIFAVSFVGCTPSGEDVSGESGVSSVGDASSSSTQDEKTPSVISDPASTTQSTTFTGNQQATNSTVKPPTTNQTSSQKPSSSSSAAKPDEPSVDYGDVEDQMYLVAAAPEMNGTLTVDTSKVVNASVVGGGINFAFSDYVYFDYLNGGGFAQTLPYHYDEAEENRRWDVFEKQLKFTGTKYVRFQVNYTQWEPINDNDDPNKTDFKKGFAFSPEFMTRDESLQVPPLTFKQMQQMYRILDIFEEMGCYVILGNWDSHSANGYCANGKNWLHDGDPVSRTKLHVKDFDEHAETYAAIMYHLIVEKGYKCVKGFSIFNEPENFDDIVGELTKAYTACDKQLRRLGIRDKVTIQGFDGGAIWTKNYGMGTTAVDKVLANCSQAVDTISNHYYPTSITQVGEWTRWMVQAAKGRPTFGGEIGIQAYNGEGLTFKLPLFNAMQVCEMWNNGLKGYGLWDYNTCGTELDTWDHYNMLITDPNGYYNLIPSPVNFYPSALIVKYIQGGSNIVSNTLQGCAINGEQQVYTTVATKGGQTTILLVNQSNQVANVSISGIDKSKKYQCHYVTEYQTDRIYPGGTYNMNHVKKVCLRPRSITVLTTYTYGTQTVR